MTVYTVQKNDSLYKISKKFGVPISKIKADNGITDDRYLIIGEDLVISLQRGVTVKRGDTLYSIANEYGVTVSDLLKFNPQLRGSTLIYPGQTIYVDRSQGRDIVVNGYAYPFINENELRAALPYLSNITVFTYGFREDGSLISADDEDIIEIAKSYGVAPIILLSTLTDDGMFNNVLSGKLFADTNLQDRVIENLIDTAISKGYEGVEIDFEFIPQRDAQGYVSFLQRLKNELVKENLPLFVALAPKTSDNQRGLLYEGHDYYGIGQVSDYVILMTYEWGYQFGPPLAVAPIKNVEEVIRYGVSRINGNKILLGIPNYGYDWTLPYVSGGEGAEGISNREALNRALEYGANIMFDDEAKTPYYNYYKDGKEHIVWFENARSIDAKLDLVDKYGLGGISIWQIMRYFPQLYSVLREKFNNTKE